MAVSGKQSWGAVEKICNQLREKINGISGLRCLGASDIPSFKLDPCKITVQVSGLGISGAAGASWLREHYGIQPELADTENILFLFTYSDEEPETEGLLLALRALADEFSTRSIEFSRDFVPKIPKISGTIKSPRD